MAKQVQYRGGEQSANEIFIGAPREITVDTDLNTLRVHDGVTPGGHLLGKWDFGPQYKGTWDASTNTPDLTQPGSVAGDFYVVAIPGNTEINGNDNWNNGDRIIWSGTAWEQIRPQTLADSTTDAIILNTNTAIFADGEPATFDPQGKAGWFFENGQGKKINWYFYALQPHLAYTLGDFEGFYMVWEKRNLTSDAFVNIYTLPQVGGGNAQSWYRSRISFADAAMANAAPGRYLVHMDGMDVSDIEPTLQRIALPISAFTTEGPQGNEEKIQSITLQSNSGRNASEDKFLVAKIGYTIRGLRQNYDLVALPQQPPNYFEYYRGTYADAADYPASGELGQWLINSTDDTTVVWDEDGGAWVATGSGAEAPTGSSIDYPFQYTYSNLDGSGYGFADAHPAVEWANTPDGKVQANQGTQGSGTNGTDILGRRIKFATIKNPGDEVTFRATDNSGPYNRYCIIGLEPGTDPSTLSWKVAGQPSSGVNWMLNTLEDRNKVVFFHAYMEPYWGGSSYGHNLTGRGNSTGLGGYYGNQGELPVTYRVGDDFRIEVYINGEFHVKNLSVPANGADLYLTTYSNTGRTFFQPLGNGANYYSNASAAATGARFFMSSVETPAGAEEMASGGGRYLYSAQNPGDASDVELDAQEAGAARFCRVFTDYSGMTLAERAEATLPIVDQDEKGLSRVEYLARGYFHSLDLELEEIAAKMALYAPALQAATAGSVEACLAQLQLLTLPVAAGGEAIDIDPFYSGYSSGGTSDTRWTIPTTSQTRADYGITAMRFWGQGTSLGQMEFYFDSNNQPNAALDWASQDRTITFNVPGSDPAFEGTYTLTPAKVAYQSGSQVTYSNPDTWNHVNVESLAQWATSNGLASGLATVTLEAPAPTSPALALGEGEVVAELIGLLQNHLLKFPR